MILLYEDHKRLTLDSKLQIGWKWKCRKILDAKSYQKRAEEAISIPDLMKDEFSEVPRRIYKNKSTTRYVIEALLITKGKLKIKPRDKTIEKIYIRLKIIVFNSNDSGQKVKEQPL